MLPNVSYNLLRGLHTRYISYPWLRMWLSFGIRTDTFLLLELSHHYHRTYDRSMSNSGGREPMLEFHLAHIQGKFLYHRTLFFWFRYDDLTA